ncbi:hypothetical protein GQ43DRAFT_478240 [Delitschia confertaspora ATCC 74209]|uniref:Uncharacterized protein n=1 Tax=Delitschia confertaspora ATCC 74209 TaxID=1513339 RepID=A0A9P4MVR7_9PLEO|nr:hypothetical protein GQ43DRAFT_478240 [Delitschia confertaspora ATCC 74209]
MGKWRYGVILDAGSSGTRVHIYRWLNSDLARDKADDSSLHSLPRIETKKNWTKKIHPGISTFGDNPHDVGPDHLEDLFKHALETIPSKEIQNTPLFLLATAGMRILPPLKQKAVLQQVCDYAKKTTDFQLPDCDLHIQVIPGETEGLYGWIAANYLLGGFDKPKEHDHGKGHHTYGFLDMGGASAQIAFAPNATEAEKHANDLTLLRLRTLDGVAAEYKVFVTTWLGFGVNQARQRYVKALVASSPDTKELPDPCLPSGLKVTTDGKSIEPGSDAEKGKAPHLVGTGKFSECMRQAYPLLEKDKPCLDTPCLINGQHVPAIDFDVNHFVGVSEYWHTTHEIFELAHKDKAYDFKTYQQRVNEFCSQSWEEIQKGVEKKKWGKKVDETTALEVCFKASWLINMLHDGIGVPRVGIEKMNGGYNGTKAVLDAAKEKGFLDPFQAVNKIDDVEVSWTLGKMVLYASSEVPAASPEALAVGFGSNEPGLPKDFQLPGGTYLPYTASDDDDWHDNLFSENPRRIPGFLIFIVILFVVGFLLCGRERRKQMRHKVRRVFGGSNAPLKRRRGFAGKLFNLGSSTPSYERVLEDGTSHNSFELGSAESYSDNEHSDSSDTSQHLGRTSGWATPQINAGLVDPSTPTYFDNNILSQGQGLGLSPTTVFGSNAMERGGLMARTESRERLAGLGRRSRASSPSRGRSPKMGWLKEEGD